MIGWVCRMLAGAPDVGEWAVAAGNDNGRPMIVRTRTRAPKGMTIERYPASVELVWRFDGGVHRGMPTPELSELMMQCENRLATLEVRRLGS